MNYEIRNDYLRVVISDKGAELQSVQTADGTEYLWQGDPAYWTSHAPNIFPYVARLTRGIYVYRGQEYGFGNHGLIRYVVLDVEEQTEDSITFRFDDTEDSFRQYPFHFTYRITFSLRGNTLVTRTSVDNRSDDRMYFAVGGHPGFNVPLEEGLSFEDYYLEFSRVSHPYQIEIAGTGAIRPGQTVYQPEGCRRIDLHHDLFDKDALVLYHADRTVTLKSDRGTRSITVRYPDFRYIGFWHKPCTEAPYLCIEPWTSLPSRENIVEDLEQQGDLVMLEKGGCWSTAWEIEIR